MNSDNVKMNSYQYTTNTALTTFQSVGSIVAGGIGHLQLLPFHVQLDFFLSNLNDLGLMS